MWKCDSIVGIMPSYILKMTSSHILTINILDIYCYIYIIECNIIFFPFRFAGCSLWILNLISKTRAQCGIDRFSEQFNTTLLLKLVWNEGIWRTNLKQTNNVKNPRVEYTRHSREPLWHLQHITADKCTH